MPFSKSHYPESKFRIFIYDDCAEPMDFSYSYFTPLIQNYFAVHDFVNVEVEFVHILKCRCS